MWKILIIDDDRVDREIYKRCLRSDDGEFEFAECGSGTTGIEEAGAWAPDCILLDFNLPDMDGLAVLGRLRRGREGLPCAVVMLTAFGGEGLAVDAMKGGAMDYLPKGQVSTGVLPHKVLNAIERFQMLRRIDQQRLALERSERQYRTLFEAIPQMVWMANAEGRVEYANCHWFEYTRADREELGRWDWNDILHPDDRELTANAWEQARRTGSVLEVEHRLRRADDGSFLWHLVRAVPFGDGAGEITNWFGTCTEIENQKKAERVNIQREKLLGIGQLAAGVAHDFNNLLVVIIGGATYSMELLPAAHGARVMLKEVVRAGERAAELTGKLLAYAGKGNQYVEATNLNELVRETCDGLRDLLPEGIRLEITPGCDMPPVTTDTRQMRQAIVDLVMNGVEAIREGADGKISIRTSATEVAEDATTVSAGKYVALEVEDTGCGMPEETQKKIFEPFFSTKFTGRGLGLAAVYGFVRSSGGDIRVESAPGQGTRFRILLPAVPVKETSPSGVC